MSTAVSHDIRISVRARFEPAQSDPVEGRFIFSYRITIANRGSRAVQLMERTWFISDSLAPQRRISGKGVVGATPELQPGEQFTYSSFCDLRSAWGRMQGHYLMRHLDDGSTFEAAIPPFDLLLEYAAN
ncbi:MAG: Co2+/Mg2+ efflux protein ApaG [Flavobacteriales bacterium]|jgi:ApaG protein